MPRDNIPFVQEVQGGQIAEGAGVAINVTNGGNLLAAGQTDNLILRVDNTTVSAKIVTVKAGVYPPAFRASLGDLAISVLASSKTYIVIESARHVQADGSVNIDYEAGMTGTVFAQKLPPELV